MQFYIRFSLLICFLSFVCLAHAQSENLSKAEMSADLIYLKNKLNAHHPNLYSYTQSQEINAWFDQQIQSLPNQTSKQDAFKIITSFSEVIKDGHSYIYPSADYLDQFFKTALLFPLDVFLADHKLIVTGDFSDEQAVPLGSELIAINGLSISAIQDHIIPKLPRDGNNMAYPKHLFYQFFPAYYSQFYGFQPQFELAFLDPHGKSTMATVKGLTRSSIRSKRNAITQVPEGIHLHLKQPYSLAILRIPSFDNKTLKASYEQKFRKEIKQVFQEIKAQNIQYLAIDLRDNQGGELSNGVFLLQHILPNPFQCVESYYKTILEKDGTRQAKRINNKWDNYFQIAKKNHFSGDVFLFTNGGSFSCSSIVANTFKKEKRGFIVGQMTGGSAFLNCGGPNKIIELPYSKIQVTIPQTQYNLNTSIANPGLGVSPDWTVPDHPKRLSLDEDPYLQVVLQTIQSSPNKGSDN